MGALVDAGERSAARVRIPFGAFQGSGACCPRGRTANPFRYRHDLSDVKIAETLNLSLMSTDKTCQVWAARARE
jgi:hypothetical protein